MKKVISLFMAVVMAFTMSLSVSAAELPPEYNANTDVVFSSSSFSEEDLAFFEKLALVYDGYKSNQAGEIVFTYSTENLYELGFTEKEIEQLNEINKTVCGTVLPDSSETPANFTQREMFVSGCKVYFTYDDVMRLLVPAAMMGPEALYVAMVTLSTLVGGVVGGTLASILGAIGAPSLGYLCYLALQAAANHQGVYIGIKMNGIFPIIDCGTW